MLCASGERVRVRTHAEHDKGTAPSWASPRVGFIKKLDLSWVVFEGGLGFRDGARRGGGQRQGVWAWEDGQSIGTCYGTRRMAGS